MRNLLFNSFFLVLFSNQAFGQLKRENFEKIIKLDEEIHQWDWGNKPENIGLVQERTFSSVEEIKVDSSKVHVEGAKKDDHEREYIKNDLSLAAYVYDYLIPLLGIEGNLYNASHFKSYLDRIRHTETITWLEYVFRDYVREVKTHPENVRYNAHQMNEMLSLINARMNEIMADKISMYRFTETSTEWVRGIYVEHGNDFLSIAPKYNDDRDMTGSFRIEIFTDKLKMRILDGYSIKFLNLNSRKYYSYQSIFVGGEGYTPYLRDTSIFNSNESVDSLDRPYASFQYFGRAKYRVSRHGRFRMFNQLKIGSIGSLRPGAIQSLIHRDITIGSFTPNGWGAQIAAGGRIGFSLEYYPELMLTKLNTNSIWNISALTEIKYGTDMTSAGLGINYCNKGFLKSGGINMTFLERSSNTVYQFFQNNFIFNARFMYRRVIHNSMLEGYGIVKHRLDEDPTSPIDKYFLKGDQIERNIFITEFSLNFRFSFCGIVFKQTIMSPEFNMPVNYFTYLSGESGAVSNHNTSKWNHYGTIGIFFLIK